MQEQKKPLIFRRIDGNSAEVEAGPLRMKVALDEITGIEQPAGSKVVTPSSVSLKYVPRETSAATALLVLGSNDCHSIPVHDSAKPSSPTKIILSRSAKRV